MIQLKMNITDCDYDERNDIILRAINYLYPIVIIIGTIANIIAFIIFSRKRFENTVFSTYFRLLLIVDSIALVYLALAKFIFFEYGINLRDINIVLCRITMPIAYSIPPLSAYITVMISFDRWMSIAKPTKFLIRKKKSFQIKVCIGIIVGNFIYNGQLFFSYLDIDPADSYSNSKVCLIYNENLLSTMDLFNSTILPFFLMILFSSLTINVVFVSRNRIRNTIFNAKMALVNNDLLSNIDTSRKRDVKLL